VGLQATITCIRNKTWKELPRPALQQQIENPVWSNQSLLILRMTSFPWLPLRQLGLRMIGEDNSMSGVPTNTQEYVWVLNRWGSVFTAENTCLAIKEHTEWRLALINIHDLDTVVLCYISGKMYCCVFLAKACLVMLIATYPALVFGWDDVFFWIRFLSHSQLPCWVINTIHCLLCNYFMNFNLSRMHQLLISYSFRVTLPGQSQHLCKTSIY